MGNTIRREPVNFSIPASPDYKFLNITNFRGLDVSSNPFELATNTASDCLNVYVDETNTLTTRPRMEKKELKDGSGKDILPLNGTCLGVYPLHDGYLFHYTQQMKVLRGDKLIEVSAESIPQKTCKHFEQGNKIYLLGDNRYMVIDENGVLSDVEGYVPIKSVVAIDGAEKSIEPLNLLSNKYVIQYMWDIDSKFNLEKDTYENNAYEQTNLGYYGDGSSLYVEAELNEETLETIHYYVVYKERDDTEPVKVYDLVGKWTVDSWSDVTPHYTPHNNKIVWYVNRKNGDVCVVYYSGTRWTHKVLTLLMDASEDPYVSIDNTGYTISYNKDSVTKTTTLDHLSGLTETTTVEGLQNCLGSKIKNGKGLFYTVTKVYISYDLKNAIEYNHGAAAVYRGCYGFLGDTMGYVITNYPISFQIFSLKTGERLTEQTITFGMKFVEEFEDYPNSLWYLDYNYKLHIIPDCYEINKNHIFTGIELKKPVVSISSRTHYYNKQYIYFDYSSNFSGSTTRIIESYSWKSTDSPNIIATHIISDNEDHTRMSTKLLSSTLFTRFDNNYWFVSGNTYFRSQNNDPTYFPITEYSELGDSNEDITGFNIANDTTLLAYKPSRLYLIQPFYSEITGMTEYTKTESKNTVGNTAIDAPIVTTLTEIPLQINYDGIYGLSQVSNVSATERIADLMSGSINDRWLNEDDEVIKKAQTLNRLYWTYIILPYTKESKVDPRDVCKVYLLDNRTNSWYYWELPIKLLNAFAKDNRAEFVDADGNIYYLTTTDIRNMGFDTQLVTEYYDCGKKLIPWYWQSQVLYLGTMNYAKRLVNTTFILTDTDTQDGYGLQYSFKVFRKLASSVPEKELSGELNLVRSTTKKTNLSKFGFLQLKLSNITEESQGTEAEKAYRNNKLRLVGLGLKYVLLEGLIR